MCTHSPEIWTKYSLLYATYIQGGGGTSEMERECEDRLLKMKTARAYKWSVTIHQTTRYPDA